MKIAGMSFKYRGSLWLAGTLALCLVLGFIYYFLALTPQLESREEIQSQLKQEKTRVASVESFLLAHPNTDQYLAGLDREILRVNTLLPDTANIGEAVAFLETTTKATGTVLGAFKTDKSVYNDNGWTETLVMFKVLGNYADLMEFAKRLDAGPRFMAVQAVEFHHRLALDGGDFREQLERELSADTGLWPKLVISRGLLSKPNLVIMNVYLVIVSQGQLPETQLPQGGQQAKK